MGSNGASVPDQEKAVAGAVRSGRRGGFRAVFDGRGACRGRLRTPRAADTDVRDNTMRTVFSALTGNNNPRFPRPRAPSCGHASVAGLHRRRGDVRTMRAGLRGIAKYDRPLRRRTLLACNQRKKPIPHGERALPPWAASPHGELRPAKVRRENHPIYGAIRSSGILDLLHRGAGWAPASLRHARSTC